MSGWPARPGSTCRSGRPIILPLGAPGDVRGVFTVGRDPGPMPLAPEAVEMVRTFAAQAGIALELAEHRQDAERLAIFQTATGSPGTCTTW